MFGCLDSYLSYFAHNYMENLDLIQYNFNQNNVLILNIAVGFIMFGVALGLSVSDFKRVVKNPKYVIAGLISQLLVLPLLTIVLIYLIRPQASVALGMILISVCPGGNISNFMSSVAKANVALSVSLTAITSTTAVLFTPFGLKFWGNFYEPANTLLRSIQLSYTDVLSTVFFIIIVPLILGMLIRQKNKALAVRWERYLKNLSMIIFLVIVLVAVLSNLDSFRNYIPIVIGIVILHNGLAIGGGYSIAKLFGLDTASTKTLMIETGIQNSGLGLAIIFSFFDGLGGMTLVAAAWGVWHIIAGLSLSSFLSRKS